jgi:transcriptional regulator with XRE-family HTH domain
VSENGKELLKEARLQAALGEFGRRVRERRKELGLSQETAAERAGIGQSQWSKVERGASEPSISHVLRIQVALGAPSIESFFGDFPSARSIARG